MSFSQTGIRWCFNVSNWKPTFEQWKLAVQCVQKDECERCYRFAFVQDCKTSMVGQLLMRKVVNECLGLPYDAILFSRSSSGKPFLEKCDGFDFNVSHHGDFCVLAAEHNSRVGVDVMKVEHRGKRSVTEFFSLMQRQFSSHEWDFIAQPGLEKEQLRRFFRLWCLKESYVKAIGTGIVVDLQSLSFKCPTPILHQGVITEDTKLYENGNLRSQWKFEETFLDGNHCVAVATELIHQKNLEEKRHESRNFVFLAFNDLMQNCKPFVQEEENFWKNFISKSEKKL
ncbi:L-aminoadipate-semialdehyde dehydrogenase-phosphopantetheinyl transferase [Araneus ventricosus]|uniref:L-aminoadipate-semialdehyde dehydrogenase-phosphopantetheinyl transferase n=1 Tax=Araneus ventricosus TaxID=182803 RepID=A0A4Y2Q0B4_ARAVE|nr:L-aminoadipate-semialdehyde dehydrogenase-phosphopantetheinyl transferase [Araneus ventricosus]